MWDSDILPFSIGQSIENETKSRSDFGFVWGRIPGMEFFLFELGIGALPSFSEHTSA